MTYQVDSCIAAVEQAIEDLEQYCVTKPRTTTEPRGVPIQPFSKWTEKSYVVDFKDFLRIRLGQALNSLDKT